MDSNSLVLKILKSPLFSSLTEKEAELLVFSSSLHSFAGGEELKEEIRGKLCLVISGEAGVFSSDGGRNTLIKTIKAGELFGVASLFSGSEPVSRIIAKVKTKLLLIDKEEIAALLSSNPGFASSYISFLEKKIAFLNKRISSFTAGSCERKLALFLASASSDESFTLNISFSSLAKQLDMGRASFYRALYALEEAGFVKKSEKSIHVLSKNAMKEKYS